MSIKVAKGSHTNTGINTHLRVGLGPSEELQGHLVLDSMHSLRKVDSGKVGTEERKEGVK